MALYLTTFVATLYTALVTERILNAIIYTILYLFGLKDESTPSNKGPSALRLLQSVAYSCFSLVSSLVAATIQSIQSIAQWSLTLFVLILISACLFLVYEFSGHFMVAAADTWNTSLGPTAQILVIWPLKIINFLAHAILPIWNAVVWMWKKVPNQILANIVTRDLGTLILSLEALAGFCKASALSIVAWVGSFVCCDTPDGFCNPRCYEAGERVLDLLGPMASIRQFVAYSAIWIKNMCNTLSGPLDVITYPFMDINLAKAVHLISNSALYTVFHLPAVTRQRCNSLGNVSAVMCVPDVDPVFQMATAGLRSMGTFMDNWIDVTVLIVEASLGIASPPCTSIPNLLKDTTFTTTLFGSNATTVVGMTPTLFARTDGWGVHYYSTARDWQTVIHPKAFPFKADISHGVAAIAHINDLHHAPDGDDTMALLGCGCADTDAGMVIECGVAVFDDQTDPATRRIPVQFQLPSTARYLACHRVKIKVQSMRWPATRTTGGRIPTMDGTTVPEFSCISKSTCLQADAALWVRPMCSSDGIDPVCVQSFKDAGCFPYCMALHVRGTATQPMVLHDAREWGYGVTQLRRDCGLFTLNDPAAAEATQNQALPATEGKVLLPSSPYGLNVQTRSFNNCTYNPTTHSIVPRPTSYAQYGSIALENQPFAFAGDLVLISREGRPDSNGNPTYFIEVQRVFGNQQNEFTIVPLRQEIPSAPPCTTPADCGNVLATCNAPSGCLPSVPYSWDAHPSAHIPATVTEQYVFYVTNPSLEPFEAFSYYCIGARENAANTNEFQISAISSYGGIRLWRLNPYIYCPVDPSSGLRFCPQSGSAGTVQIEALRFTSFSVEMCTTTFAVFAVGLDYVNEYNLALTVLRTTLDNINTITLQVLDPTRATYPVLWVNPTTMRWREDKMWMPEAPSPALTDGQLCPSQRRTPNVGSILTESLISMLLLVRLPLNVVMGLPVATPLINGNCPVITGGHHMLRSCGAELLSLDDFYHSVFRANNLLFQGFAIVADGFGPGFPQTFINGFTLAAENGPYTPILPGFAKQLAELGHLDPMQALLSLQNTVATLPAPVLFAKAASHQPMAISHFAYRIMSRMLMRILQTIDGGRTIGNLFWSTLADAFDDYEVRVSTRMRAMCGGLALMAGGDSPLGQLTDHWCRAFVSLETGVLTLVTVFTVDVPLFACVCRDSAGSNFRAFVLEKCYPDAPDSHKPLLVNLLASFADDSSQICPALVAMAQKHFTGALDEMFSDIASGTSQLASVVDSFLSSIDTGAGDCNNFVDNPYVMALIPQPVDYFRVCGLTEICRSRCSSEFTAFEAVNTAPPASETVTETVRSPLFPQLDEAAYSPFRSGLALMELPSCKELCGSTWSDRSAVRDRCFLAAGELWDSTVGVIGYCAPIDITAGVRKSDASVLEAFPQKTTETAFVWRPDYAASGDTFWASFKLLAMTPDTMYECHTTRCLPMYTLADLAPDVTQLSGFAILGNTVIQKTRHRDGVLPYSTSARIYTFTLLGIYRSHPTSHELSPGSGESISGESPARDRGMNASRESDTSCAKSDRSSHSLSLSSKSRFIRHRPRPNANWQKSHHSNRL